MTSETEAELEGGQGKDGQKASRGCRGGPLARTKQTFALILIV